MKKQRLIKLVLVMLSFMGLACVSVPCASADGVEVFAIDAPAVTVNEGEDGVDEIDGVNEVLPELYIKAINPGYTVDGVGNVGEMIEIRKNSSDEMISLAGATVGYTNSSGNYSVLFEFPENSWITGESILLRLASSPDSELAAVTYSKTLAFKGGIDLRRGEEVIDNVCWNGKKECYREFSSSKSTILVRNDQTGLFEHLDLDSYEPLYAPDSYYVKQSEVSSDEEARIPSQCVGLEFSELLSYYDNSRTEQFIELHNYAAEQILLDGCVLRYKNKNYKLGGIIKADGYKTYYPVEFSLTKNPTNGNTIELYDVDGAKLDSLFYPNGQKKGTSYALIGYDEGGGEIWRTTYLPTPGEPNVYQEYKTCEAGKVINAATGNCVKVAVVTEKTCPEGQYLNILTGRCKKIQEQKEKTCKEGYYLNPETGRCRKVVENSGADYSVEPEEYEEKSSFVALYAVVGVLIIGLLFLMYEFRLEIGRLCGRVFRRFH